MPPVGKTLQVVVQILNARPMFLRLFLHCVRRAASRAAWIAGKQQRDQNADDRNDDQ